MGTSGSDTVPPLTSSRSTELGPAVAVQVSSLLGQWAATRSPLGGSKAGGTWQAVVYPRPCLVHVASTQSTPPVNWYPDRTTRPGRRRWSRLVGYSRSCRIALPRLRKPYRRLNQRSFRLIGTWAGLSCASAGPEAQPSSWLVVVGSSRAVYQQRQPRPQAGGTGAANAELWKGERRGEGGNGEQGGGRGDQRIGTATDATRTICAEPYNMNNNNNMYNNHIIWKKKTMVY